MALPTINTIWANGTYNKSTFSEEQKKTGIVYQGAVVSNELNGVLYDTQRYIDTLQRAATGWNSYKQYDKGDTVILNLNYNNNNLYLTLQSLKDKNNFPPLLKKNSTVFTLDENRPLPLFTITSEEGNIENYLNNNYWAFVEDVGVFKNNNKLNDLNTKIENIKSKLEEMISFNYKTIYPVGSIYISLDKNFNPNITFTGTLWEKIKEGIFLEATEVSDNVGQNVDAGLPNIRGHLEDPEKDNWEGFEIWASSDYPQEKMGCFETGRPFPIRVGGSQFPLFCRMEYFRINASKYNPIYSDEVKTVQPKSIRCFMWKRTV